MTYRHTCNHTSLHKFDTKLSVEAERRELVSVTKEVWKDGIAYFEAAYPKAAEYQICDVELPPFVEILPDPATCCSYTQPDFACALQRTYRAGWANFHGVPDGFVWSTNIGTIVFGQGTDTVVIETVAGADVDIVASVIVTQSVSGDEAETSQGFTHCHNDDTICPTFTGADVNDQQFTIDVPITPFDISGLFTGYVVSYALVGTWPPGLVIDPITGIITGTPTVEGVYGSLQILAASGGGCANAITNPFAVEIVDATPETLIVSEVTPGACSYSDPDVDCVASGVYIATPDGFANTPDSWEWSITLGTGTIVAGQGTDTVTVETTAAVDVTFTLKCIATFTPLSETAQDSTQFTQTHTNTTVAPVFDGTIDDFHEIVGVPVTPYDAAARFTTGGAVVTYALINAPSWMLINSLTGLITGTPDVVATTPNVRVSATNSAGTVESNAFTVYVTEGAPVFDGAMPDIDGDRCGGPETYDASVHFDTGGAVTSYSLQNEPAWMTIDPITGIITVTVGVLGTASGITVTGTNAQGPAVSDTFSSTISLASFAGYPKDLFNSAVVEDIEIHVMDVGACWEEVAGETVVDINHARPETLSGVVDELYATTPSGFSDYVLTADIIWRYFNSSLHGSPYLVVRYLDLANHYFCGPSGQQFSIFRKVAGVVVEVATAVHNQGYDPGAPRQLEVTCEGPVITMRLGNPGGPIDTLTWNSATEQQTATTVGMRFKSNGIADTDAGPKVSDFEMTSISAIPPPIFDGTIPDFAETTGAAMAPFGTSSYFSLGGPVDTYSLQNKPAWMSINAGTGVITGTPPAEATTNGVTVTATNGGGSAVSNAFDVVVTDALQAPTFDGAIADFNEKRLEPMTPYDASARFTTGDPVDSYSLQSAPAWMSINTSTGVITGTPDATATSAVSVLATNAAGSTPSNTFDVIVAEAAPIYNGITPNLGDLTVDVLMTPYDFSNHYSGDPVDSYAISVTPAGLSFDTGTGILSGTPTTIADTTGITVTATNTGGSTPTNAFNINVTSTLAPPIFDGVIADFTETFDVEMVPYDTSVHFTTGGFVSGYTLTNELSWMQIDSVTGIMTGTPDVSGTRPNITVTGANTSGAAVSNSFSMTIEEAVSAPIFTGPVVIPDVNVDAVLSHQMNQYYSGSAVDSYALTNDGGATWLSINTSTGELSGTAPAAAVTVSGVIVTATNTGGSTPTDAFGLEVVEGAVVYAFVMAFATTTASEDIVLPSNSTGTYNYNVDWGDGQTDSNITVWDAPESTHTYAAANTYEVRITGTFSRVSFGTRSASKNKIMDVKNWGDVGFSGTFYRCFYLCNNLDVTAIDGGDNTFTNVTSFQQAFQTTLIGDIHTDGWDTSNNTTFKDMFRGSDANPDISSWDISSLTDAGFMFLNVTTWTTANYDAMLAGWSGQAGINSGVPFHAGSTKYTDATSRAVLTDAPNNWTITDDGQA